MTQKLSLKDMTWSEQSYRLSDVVQKVGFPCVVKVCHAYHGSFKTETFSHGDLLHLKDCVTLQKVAAHFIQREYTQQNESKWMFKTIGEEVLIPLNFKGPMKRVNDSDIRTKFNNVQELIDSFPRFVKIDKEIEGLCGKRGSRKIKLSEGKQLQLVRLLPGTLHKHKKNTDQLICIYKDKEIGLTASTKGTFTLMPDDTSYTLASLVETLPLPRYVTFIDGDLQQTKKDENEFPDDVCGRLVCLNRIVLQKVILGYHDPVGIETSHHGPDGVIALPLDNQAVNVLEVNILKECDSGSYKKIMPKNIKNILDKEDLRNWLYVEQVDNPKVRYLFDDFPGRKVINNSECCCIDDISSTRLKRKVKGSISGSQDGWSSSEFSMSSQDVITREAVYEFIDDAATTRANQADHLTTSTETDDDPFYEYIAHCSQTTEETPSAASKALTTATDGDDKEGTIMQESQNSGINDPELSSTSSIRTEYINMPFFKRAATKQDNVDDEDHGVKTPPPKPPRKDKGFKRLFSFGAAKRKPLLKSTIPETAQVEEEDSTPLKWKANPMFSLLSDTYDKICDEDTLTEMLDSTQNVTKQQSVMQQPLFADSIAVSPKCNSTNPLCRRRNSSSGTSVASSTSVNTLKLSNSYANFDDSMSDFVFDKCAKAEKPKKYSIDDNTEYQNEDRYVSPKSPVFTLTETERDETQSTHNEILPIESTTQLHISQYEIELDKRHDSEPANSENDLEHLIGYFNSVSETLTGRCNPPGTRQDPSTCLNGESPITFDEDSPKLDIEELLRMCEEEKECYDKLASDAD